MNMIRKQCRHGLFIIHNHDGGLWAEVNNRLYFWNPDSRTGGAGQIIEHGGNHLHGTEYRRPYEPTGDWVEYPHLEYGHVVTTAALHYLINFWPGKKTVDAALNGIDILEIGRASC